MPTQVIPPSGVPGSICGSMHDVSMQTCHPNGKTANIVILFPLPHIGAFGWCTLQTASNITRFLMSGICGFHPDGETGAMITPSSIWV